MSRETLTFFVPVTDRDAVIADYAVSSYQRLRHLDIPFRVLVYSNNLSAEVKDRHFPRWTRFNYVEIKEADLSKAPSPGEEEDTDTSSVYYRGAATAGRKAYRYEGPWERYERLLDRELKCIDSSHVVSADADFEILNGDFVQFIVDRMRANPNLKVMSSDYSPTRRYDTDAFGSGYCYLQERYHSWFCVYKREVLDFPESHKYRDVQDPETGEYLAWDASAYFQQRLRLEMGYEMACADHFDRSFIHYSAFSKNRTVNSTNVKYYRALKVAPKVPLVRQTVAYPELGLIRKVDARLSRAAAPRLLSWFFDETERQRPVYADMRSG